MPWIRTSKDGGAETVEEPDRVLQLMQSEHVEPLDIPHDIRNPQRGELRSFETLFALYRWQSR